MGKQIYIGAKPRVSLPSLFEAASAEERVRADARLLEGLLDIADGYIEAQRNQTKARTVKAVEAWLNEAQAEGVKTDLQTVLGGELEQVFGKVTSDMHRIVATEATAARNTGTLDGIVRVNASQGIEDPIVYFVVVRDDSLCAECKRLHLLDDETTPRLWYLSELRHSYHKKGDDAPSLNGEHPHCRCSLVTLMPGYGFDGSGMVEFVAVDHDEMKVQRP